MRAEVLTLGDWAALAHRHRVPRDLCAAGHRRDLLDVAGARRDADGARARAAALRARRRGRGGGARARHPARDDQARLDRARRGARRPAAPAGGRAAGPRPGRPLHRDPAGDGAARQGGRAGPPRARSRASSRRRRRRTPTAASGSSPASRAPRSRTGPRCSRSSPAGRRSSRACATWCRTPSTSPARRCGSTSTGAKPSSGSVIGDDGRGYPADLIGRIGDPFVRRRAGPPGERPGYEGMGLGLFIAKTLLERSGATPELRQRHAGGRARPARVRPAERRRRHRRLAAHRARPRAVAGSERADPVAGGALRRPFPAGPTVAPSGGCSARRVKPSLNLVASDAPEFSSGPTRWICRAFPSPAGRRSRAGSSCPRVSSRRWSARSRRWR